MGYGIDLTEFNKYAKQLGELAEDAVLMQAANNALTKTKDYLNGEIDQLLDKSVYNFKRGQGYSKGKTAASLGRVTQMQTEQSGNTLEAYVGVKLKEALEYQFIIHGTPHMAADTNLYNATKAKGKYDKEIKEIQKNEFNKVIEEVLQK